MLLRREEGGSASVGLRDDSQGEAPEPSPASPQLPQQEGCQVKAEDACPRLQQSQHVRGDGASAEGQGDPPAGAEALQEERAGPEAAEGWRDGRGG